MAQQQVQARTHRATIKRRRNQHINSSNIINPNKPPALSTRSKTKITKPPIQQSSRLRQPTASFSAKQQANAVYAMTTKQKWEMFRRLEQQIGEAMAVMDKDSGKLLNYRQLLQHPISIQKQKNGVFHQPMSLAG